MTQKKQRATRSTRAGGTRKSSRRQRNVKASGGMIPHPPQINGYEVTHSKVLRFRTTSAQFIAVTYQNLLDTILMTTSATAPFDLFSQVRVRSVRVWAIAAQGVTNSASVIFDGGTAGSTGDRKVHTDTSMGVEPAYVNARPAPKSLASMFQVSSDAIAFQLDVPTQAVVDVALDFRSDVQGNNPVAAQNVSVLSTVGVIAQRGLDGLAVASSQFVSPAGVYTI
jgi:hypothetical protein